MFSGGCMNGQSSACCLFLTRALCSRQTMKKSNCSPWKVGSQYSTPMHSIRRLWLVGRKYVSSISGCGPSRLLTAVSSATTQTRRIMTRKKRKKTQRHFIYPLLNRCRVTPCHFIQWMMRETSFWHVTVQRRGSQVRLSD
ncbi:hypothetical protein K503DRAFT_126548 [Rhizopogon vinicolor AM-OR11-026]|uniref:Uncharacterized protein n=1 Tax=Rhizopogon vinicolor AM-OR11-026 TaxID=1314800 RepID=A0A1B7NFD8_9AGAM|nr:hypothetical protein K503DRAFT_126548 [Rhizopogon vinicolor AM-OR11-026]